MRPRIRTIKPEFFKDEKINSITVGSRYTAIGLMSAADDRGRLQCMMPAIRAYVFPNGDVSERQFEKALAEVLGIGFAWRYEVTQWSYLWLPNFWKHQRINRPSESDLPPHPDDPHGGLPVVEALRQFTERSRNGHGSSTEYSVSVHGGLTTSRVGARSVPVPIPEELLPHLEKTLEVLESLAERHGAKAVSRDSLASVIAGRPRKPLVRSAYDCAAWWDGQTRRLRDVVSAYRNWLDRTDDLAAVEPLTAGARVVQLQRPAALQRADAWLAHYPEEGAS